MRNYTLTIEVATVREPGNFRDMTREYLRALNGFDGHARFYPGDPFVVERPAEPAAGGQA